MDALRVVVEGRRLSIKIGDEQMRATTAILGFGLLAISLPAAAQTTTENSGASSKSEARVGSLAPDEARRAERARRRAAEKNAKAANRDTDRNLAEGKSVAVPDKAASADKDLIAPVDASSTPVGRKTAAARHNVEATPKTAARTPEPPATATQGTTAVAPAPSQDVAKEDGYARDKGSLDRSRSADRAARSHDRHARHYASRRKAYRERLATAGASGRRASPYDENVIVAEDPQVALPPGAPPYPLPPRGPREVYVVREVPSPAYYGPRPFYPARVPGFAREPIDDVE